MLSNEKTSMDKQIMVSFICDRMSEDRITLADGPEGEIWADLFPAWDDQFGWDLHFETNEPEWVNLKEIYLYFRRREMTWWEWESALGLAPSSQRLAATVLSTRALPAWDADLGKLWCGPLLIKTYREAAENQRLVLAALEEQNWRHRIDDPISRRRGEAPWKPGKRLRDTISGLNADHVHPGVIRFKADGTGEGVIWDWCD